MICLDFLLQKAIIQEWCEAVGGVNPNVAVNGVFLGDGTGGPLVMSSVTDPTGGLLASLVAIVSNTPVGICGGQFTVNLSGTVLTLAEQNGVWRTIVPVLGPQYLWCKSTIVRGVIGSKMILRTFAARMSTYFDA